MANKILACDDEPFILAAISRLVQGEGFSLITARDGEEALRLAKAEHPDVVLLDIRMPRKDGFQVCRELKAAQETRDIYIIMLTAMGQERDMEQGYGCGADEFLTKPFSPRALKARLHELLDSSGRQVDVESLPQSTQSLTEELLVVYEELSLLYSLSAQLGRLTSEDEIAAVALREAKEVLNADCGWAVVFEKDALRIPEGCLSGIEAGSAVEISSAALGNLLREGKHHLILHSLDESTAGATADTPARLLASAVEVVGTPHGYLCLGRKGTGPIFTSADLKLIDAVTSLTAVELENVTLRRSELDKQRMVHELEMARKIQQLLLPEDFCRSGVMDAAGLSEPCFEIGGDYYDLFPIDGESCLMVIADVTGKGAPASLQAALIQGIVHGSSRHTTDLSLLMTTLNRALIARAVEGKFPTAFLAIIDREGRLTYANAGHNSPIWIRRSGGIAELKEGGLLLGLRPDATYPVGSVHLEPGDLVVLYTDGVTDCENARGELFGSDRLLEWASRQAGCGPLQVRESLLSTLKAYCGGCRQTDDLTALIIRRTSDLQS